MHLAGLKNLRALYLWQSAATPAGVERLRAELPKVRADLGISQAEADSIRAQAKTDSARRTAEKVK